MPTVIVEGPRIDDLETKKLLINELTAAAARACGLPRHIIQVLIRENPPDNAGTRGRLLSHKRK